MAVPLAEEGVAAAPVVIATAKALLKRAAPYLKDAARFALETAGVSVVAAKSLNVTPTTAPIIIQALGTNPELATQAASMLASVSGDDGVKALISSLGKSAAAVLSRTDSKGTSGGIISSDGLVKMALIRSAIQYFGSAERLIALMEVFAVATVSDINEVAAIDRGRYQ